MRVVLLCLSKLPRSPFRYFPRSAQSIFWHFGSKLSIWPKSPSWSRATVSAPKSYDLGTALGSNSSISQIKSRKIMENYNLSAGIRDVFTAWATVCAQICLCPTGDNSQDCKYCRILPLLSLESKFRHLALESVLPATGLHPYGIKDREQLLKSANFSRK